MAEAHTAQEHTGPILDWLTSQPSADLDHEVRQLASYLEALYSPTIPTTQFERSIELFYIRGMRMAAELRRDTRHCELPLPEERLFRARSLAESLKRIAQGFEKILLDAPLNKHRIGHARRSETAPGRALRLLGESYLILGQVGIDAEPMLWKLAYRLFLLSCNADDSLQPVHNPSETALSAFKQLLALTALEPQSLSSAELDWAAEYVGQLSNLIHVQNTPPASLDGPWHWLDPYGSGEPQACVRCSPPGDRPILFFSTAALARRTSDVLARYEQDPSNDELQTGEQFPSVAPFSLLTLLRQRWHTPSGRAQPRRRQDYKVEACIGLQAIWDTLRTPHEAEEAESVSEWVVTNESPGGYAIMRLQGRSRSLVPGIVVALRRDPSEPWSICIVRWLRSDVAEQVEIGLQMVSKNAIPVRVAFRGTDNRTLLRNALVLPVLPALRQHQAILAPAGTYASRRFTLISDVDRVYVAQCRLLTLDIQTSGLELFQFEIDPYPI